MKEKKDPPLFKTWPRFYLVVAGWLLVQILLYYLFTLHYS